MQQHTAGKHHKPDEVTPPPHISDHTHMLAACVQACAERQAIRNAPPFRSVGTPTLDVTSASTLGSSMLLTNMHCITYC